MFASSSDSIITAHEGLANVSYLARYPVLLAVLVTLANV